MGKFGWSYPPGAENDPFAPYNQADEWGMDMDELRDALSAHDSGRWDWDRIDCCLSGKDADLEPEGEQGIELISCDDEQIQCVAHIGKTIPGDDVALNIGPEIENGSDDQYQSILEAYLEQACEVVCGCDTPGEWDGDSWYLSDSVSFSVNWRMLENGTDIDYEGTAQQLVDAAYEALRPIMDELVIMDDILNDLSGWTEGKDENGKPIRCKPGEPGIYAVWKHGEVEKGRVTIDDDGYNMTVTDRHTSEPLIAFCYGEFE